MHICSCGFFCYFGKLQTDIGMKTFWPNFGPLGVSNNAIIGLIKLIKNFLKKGPLHVRSLLCPMVPYGALTPCQVSEKSLERTQAQTVNTV